MRRTYRRPKPKTTVRFRVNYQIRIPEVFLIDENGERIGVIATPRAMAMAQERDLDLVEVNPKVNPSVVKIIDYGQFKYEKDKQIQKQKIKQKKAEVKGVRLSMRISKHDFNFRIDQAKKFLSKGHKLKIELILKGRERQHSQKAIEIINSFINILEEDNELNIVREQNLTNQGGRFSIILANK